MLDDTKQTFRKFIIENDKVDKGGRFSTIIFEIID